MGFACPICSDSLIKTPIDDVQNAGQEAKVSATPCGHFFHHYCITKWLQGTLATSNKCPCCRKDVPRGRCLPLFPTIQDDSILDDSFEAPSQGPCGHEPQLRELRQNCERLESKCSELETIHQTITDDLENEKSKLLMEKKRSEKYMFQCKLFESCQEQAAILEEKLNTATAQLKSLKAIQDCVNEHRQESESELNNWPVTAQSIKCLVDIKVALSSEVRGQSTKIKAASNERERIKASNFDLNRQLQNLKNYNDDLKNENAHLKIELEELHSRMTSLNSSPCFDVTMTSVTGGRKRKSDVVENLISNADDSVVILSPTAVDDDIAVLEPFHNKSVAHKSICRTIGTKSANDLTGSSKSAYTFKKKAQSEFNYPSSSATNPSTSSNTKSNLKQHNPVALCKPARIKDIIKSDVELSPLDFQSNIKSSLPGLTDTPITQMNSRFQTKVRSTLSKRPKVLQK